MQGPAKPRGACRRQGDDELPQAIHRPTDARPTYGYRRITALLNRTRRASGADPVNHKCVSRLMRQAQLLLQSYVGLQAALPHEGNISDFASNRAGRPMCWKSAAGTVRSSASPSRSTPATGDHRLARHHRRHHTNAISLSFFQRSGLW